MNVIAAAKRIGLIAPDGTHHFGTIEKRVVLAAIAELAAADRAGADLYEAAVIRIGAGRDAGVEGPSVQLRYRAEMAGIFTDLAIDVALGQAARERQVPELAAV